MEIPPKMNLEQMKKALEDAQKDIDASVETLRTAIVQMVELMFERQKKISEGAFTDDDQDEFERKVQGLENDRINLNERISKADRTIKNVLDQNIRDISE